MKELLEKGAIRDELLQGPVCQPSVPNMDGGQRPVINLKDLNTFIDYKHLKMEGLHLLREILEQGDNLCKLDLKDAYFCVPLNIEQNSQ